MCVKNARVKRGGKLCNFNMYKEVDNKEVPTALRLGEYGTAEEFGMGATRGGGPDVDSLWVAVPWPTMSPHFVRPK